MTFEIYLCNFKSNLILRVILCKDSAKISTTDLHDTYIVKNEIEGSYKNGQMATIYFVH
jgi:hypothetical protein